MSIPRLGQCLRPAEHYRKVQTYASSADRDSLLFRCKVISCPRFASTHGLLPMVILTLLPSIVKCSQPGPALETVAIMKIQMKLLVQHAFDNCVLSCYTACIMNSGPPSNQVHVVINATIAEIKCGTIPPTPTPASLIPIYTTPSFHTYSSVSQPPGK